MQILQSGGGKAVYQDMWKGTEKNQNNMGRIS